MHQSQAAFNKQGLNGFKAYQPPLHGRTDDRTEANTILVFTIIFFLLICNICGRIIENVSFITFTLDRLVTSSEELYLFFFKSDLEDKDYSNT